MAGPEQRNSVTNGAFEEYQAARGHLVDSSGKKLE